MALSRRVRALATLSISGLLGLAAAHARADDRLAAGLREEVITVTRPGLLALDLQATLYRPPGDGPFPLVVVNHPKGTAGDPHFEQRARYPYLARELLARGYAVVIPERAGQAQSGGRFVMSGCDLRGAAEASAADVDGAIASLATRPDIDTRHVVLVGFGWGGIVSLAAAAQGRSPIAGTVNVEGFLAMDKCPSWNLNLADAMASFGQRKPVPSLWFYAPSAPMLPDETWHRMADAYTAAGAPMTLVTSDAANHDARSAFATAQGVRSWLPAFERFFHDLGLPFEVRHRVVIEEHDSPPPPPTSFAPLDDVSAPPGLNDKGRAGYAAFLAQPPPRAFALGPGGAWHWSANTPTAMRTAVEQCEKAAHGQPCRLYAVDDAVVYAAPARP